MVGPNKCTSIDTHTHAQYSHASVGLASSNVHWRSTMLKVRELWTFDPVSTWPRLKVFISDHKYILDAVVMTMTSSHHHDDDLMVTVGWAYSTLYAMFMETCTNIFKCCLVTGYIAQAILIEPWMYNWDKWAYLHPGCWIHVDEAFSLNLNDPMFIKT